MEPGIEKTDSQTIMEPDIETAETTHEVVVKKRSKLLNWLQTQVDNDQHLLEVELTALALQVGIIDACTFPKFHCFVSNQTGNTVLFAASAFSLFGTRQQTDFMLPVSHLATSLGFFNLGVFAAGQSANYFQCAYSRWWLLLTNLIQTLMVLISALLAHVYPTGTYGDNGSVRNSPSVLSIIGLLAFAAGAQVAMSRQLGMPEIPTTQATAAYVDLFVDRRFFAPICQNRSRNRRIVFLVTLLVGSFIGAPAYRYVSAAFCMLLAGLVKVVVLIFFFFNKSKIQRERSLSVFS